MEEIEEYGREGEEFIDLPYVKADVLERYVAKLIDFIIAGAFYGLLNIVGPLAAILYILIADGLGDGRSLGKRITGLRVVSLEREGGACDFRESVLRNAEFAIIVVAYLVVGWIPYIGKFFVVVGGAAVLFTEAMIVYNDENGIRFGDRVARTMVVKG